jgi:nitric oxide dioxygenase
MTRDDIALVRTSFAAVVPIADEAAALFYARLFELAPDTRPLFSGDVRTQGRKLMTMIGTVVHSLDNLAPLLAVIDNLGRRHVGYGVRDEHYAVVGEALLWTLGQGLGERFTPATREAWANAYTLLSGRMMTAAAEGAKAA